MIICIVYYYFVKKLCAPFQQGNRSSSSACGSADVLEALGVAIDLGPEVSTSYCICSLALSHAKIVNSKMSVCCHLANKIELLDLVISL